LQENSIKIFFGVFLSFQHVFGGDSILKMCAGQLPESDPDLAFQPTMSRFENSVSRSDLFRIAECSARAFINSYETEPKVIIIRCLFCFYPEET